MSASPSPPQVLRSIRSPRGFYILPIHYSADPVKDAAWYASERRKHEREEDWNREFEIDFTAVSGIRAYPAFRHELHCVAGLQIIPTLPLCLMCDFNVAPHIWIVGQIHGGQRLDCVRQLRLNPGGVADMVREFRNRWPAHQAGVWVYGDATGQYRDVQTTQSDYDLLVASFRGYSSPPELRVPRDNPREKNRIDALNTRLRDTDGQAHIRIDPEGCPDLVRDLAECVLKPDGSGVLKVRDSHDPYHERTHASDGVGYLVWREWPTADEAMRAATKPKPREPLIYKRLLGEFSR